MTAMDGAVAMLIKQFQQSRVDLLVMREALRQQDRWLLCREFP